MRIEGKKEKIIWREMKIIAQEEEGRKESKMLVIVQGKNLPWSEIELVSGRNAI